MKKKYQEPTMRLHLLHGSSLMVNASQQVNMLQQKSIYIGDIDED